MKKEPITELTIEKLKIVLNQADLEYEHQSYSIRSLRNEATMTNFPCDAEANLLNADLFPASGGPPHELFDAIDVVIRKATREGL